MKTKKIYKIIACVSIWLSVILAFFGLALAKPKAGVIIDRELVLDNNLTGLVLNVNDAINRYVKSETLYAWSSMESNYIQFTMDFNDGSYTTVRFQGDDLYEYPTVPEGWHRTKWFYNKSGIHNIFLLTYFDYNEHCAYIKVPDSSMPWAQSANVKQCAFGTGFVATNNRYFYTLKNTIASIENIYDLKQNDVALIYISDISGISATMTDEITINWGYIDSTDNNVFSVYAPKIRAQIIEADDLLIRLSVPTNNAGSTANTYDISQGAILSLGTGSATATAHIYGLYVWLQSNRIQWGLAEFDTTSTPASGYSMNYITSLTSLYDYTASSTQTMTCRLSISDNFNFITIKNQPILSANNINTVIQQGGFLPAWSLYNWARGSASGYISGEQAGAAPYQPGGAGYQEIFEAGRTAGINENVGTVNWFVSAFQAVDAMLNIRIFPNITIGYLVGIPFVISVVWFIIRMFRGGGSSS